MNDDDLLRRLLDLVAGLISKTGSSGDGDLKWEKVDRDTYEVSLTRTTLRISTEDGDGRYPFIFTILDENGIEIDRLSESANSPNYRLDELHTAAARSYTGIEQKLDDLFKELGIRPRPDFELPRRSKTDDPWGSQPGEPPF